MADPWVKDESSVWGKTLSDESILRSENQNSNRQRDANHAHGFTDGTFSYKVAGKTAGGTNEVVGIATALVQAVFGNTFESSGDNYTTNGPD